ncbi:hypothetical protein HELRODRAFT_186199 [Helobdella robusta]|uniref:Receptor expression-enhancing protein n=1 Tax=Helobdella robusta TaxID=6412 RepID=T1FNT1_HELRO|nr:hypothetical protein HELRODRAFT_186199 [Helobdella robusta]ESN90969.1 hypothetical protein HELRODRAFT_186199 [Helobdella robusta]
MSQSSASSNSSSSSKSQYEVLRESLRKKLSEKNFLTDLLARAELSTGLDRVNIVLGLGILIGLYLMIGYGSSFLCNLIGFAYPAYKSIKAIESKDKDDDTKWLIYWVVYSLFLLCEYFADLLLFWIPLYWFLKCVFLIYCMLPEPYNGSIFIYSNIVRKFFLKHRATIESGVQQATDIGRSLVDEGKKLAEDSLNDVLRNSLKSD